MSLSFHARLVREKDAARQALQKDTDNFLQAGGRLTVLAPQKSARDYSKTKTHKELKNERKARLGLDGKPLVNGRMSKAQSIKTLSDVVKRNRGRNG